jgi:hypothetical protein
MKVIFTLVLTFLVYPGLAQQNTAVPVKQNSISITFGSNQFKDENLHPKVFLGPAIGSSFLHSRISKNISEYSAGLMISVINTHYEDFPSAASILILGNYRYLFPVTGNENLDWYLGPAVGLQYGTNAYFNWDESHLYFANYLGGGIGNRIIYRMGDKSFGFGLEIPLVSVICRPENNRQYKIDDMTFGGVFKNLVSNPELAFPDKNFYMKSGLEMKHVAKRGKTRAVGYNFMYHRIKATGGNPYQNIENTLSYKFIF